MTARVKLQDAERILLAEVQIKNPDVSFEMLYRDRTPLTVKIKTNYTIRLLLSLLYL